MSPYTPEEIEERFARLPEPLKEHMMSVENSERIFEVGKKFGMTIEQIGFLAEESGYVVLGLTHPKDFVTKLKDHLRVDEEKAKMIAKEINHYIFFPLREMLKSTHQFELTQEQIQESPPSIPVIPRVQSPIPIPIPSVPPMPSINNPTPPPTPPSPLSDIKRPAFQGDAHPMDRPITPTPPLPSQNAGTPTIPIPKTAMPMPPSPARPPEPITSPLIHHPSPPTTSQTPSPLSHPNLSALDGKKSETPTPSALQNEIHPTTQRPVLHAENPSIKQPIAPAISKSIEGIKPKEPAPLVTPVSQQPPQTPLAPSQMMQKNLLEEKKHEKIAHLPEADGQHKVLSPVQPEVERMKESLFAPPSAPLQPKTETIQSPPRPKTQISAPPPQSSTKSMPSSYPAHDPYREPIE